MEFESLEQYEKQVDKIISDNINDDLSEENLNEIIEITAKLVNESHLQLTNEQFEAITQISLAISKAVSKSIVYATIESLHEISETLPDR